MTIADKIAAIDSDQLFIDASERLAIREDCERFDILHVHGTVRLFLKCADSTFVSRYVWHWLDVDALMYMLLLREVQVGSGHI